MNVAMLKWYDNIPYSSIYDETMIGYRDNVSKNASADNLKGYFSQTVNADSVITHICSLDGVSYAGTDGSVLKSPRTLSMSQTNYDAAKKLSEYQTTKCGLVDQSFDSFYTLSEKGKPLDITYAQANDARKTVLTSRPQKISLQKTQMNTAKTTTSIPVRIANGNSR